MSSSRDPVAHDNMQALTDELRRTRHDLDVQFDRIAEIQAQLDEMIAQLQAMQEEWMQLKLENRGLVDEVRRSRQHARDGREQRSGTRR
jgi:regulator of replication initiation timing